MSRKEMIYTVEEDGRDKGKAFYIREMSAMRAEKWAIRAMQAAARAGVQITPEITAGGMQSLATLGLMSIVTAAFDELEPLLDEMMSCVLYIPDPARPEVRRAIIEDDIEEVPTVTMIRMQVLTLHTSFLKAGAQSSGSTPASATA